MTGENTSLFLGPPGCKKYAWVIFSLLLFFFCIIFVISGAHLMFADAALSEKCYNDSLILSRPDIAKACEEERWVKRLMINTGYAMSCIGLIFGFAFIVINVCFCIKMARSHNSDCVGCQPEQAHTTETDFAAPPNYDEACRAQIEIDDDSINYRPPSIPPPRSSQHPSQMLGNSRTSQAQHK